MKNSRKNKKDSIVNRRRANRDTPENTSENTTKFLTYSQKSKPEINWQYILEHSAENQGRLVNEINNNLGFILTGYSGSGKSFLGFSICREYKMKGLGSVKIFSPSNIWEIEYGGGVSGEAVELVYVGTSLFNPIDEYGEVVMTELEYEWLRQQLLKEETAIFKIKYVENKRILAFVKLCLKILFDHNDGKKINHEDARHYLIVFEETQLAFRSASLNSAYTNAILKYISLGRSDANLHYLMITQRLAEVSTKIVERFDLITTGQVGDNSIRKVQRSLPKEWRKVVYELTKRLFLWRHLNQVVLFRSLDYQMKGEPRRKFPPQPKPVEKKSFWNFLRRKKSKTEKDMLPFSNNSEEDPDSEDIDSESEIEIDESEEYEDEW